MSEALLFLIRTIADLLVMVVLVRFLLQYFRADFRNPIAQAILQVTSPLIVPVRKIIPAIGKIDTATIVLAIAIEVLFVLLMYGLVGLPPNPLWIAIYAVVRTVMLTIRVLIFAIFISVILSWIATGYNPAVAMISTLSEPILRPFRRFVPLLGGLDLSPLVALLLLSALNIMVAQWLPGFLR